MQFSKQVIMVMYSFMIGSFVMAGATSAVAEENQIKMTNASANQNSDEMKFLSQGKYGIGGSFTFATSAATTYDIYGSVDYFYRDNFSVLGGVGVSANSVNSVMFLNAGLSYYFEQKGKFVPFVGEVVQISQTTPISISGSTLIGAIYFLTSNIAFRTYGNLHYPLSKSGDASFSVMGNFVIYL